MNIRALEDRDEARALAPLLETYAAEAVDEFRDQPLPAGLGETLIERVFQSSHGVLLVAGDDAGAPPAGICVTAPLEDPLTGEVLPLVVLLHVDPAHRHRGLARALVAQAREILAARGHARLAARAGHNDDALISMGERWGYLRQWELMLSE